MIDGAGSPFASALRSATSSPITSPSGRTISGSPIPNYGRRASARNCWSAICPPTYTASRASGAGRRSSGRSRSCPGEQNMAHSIANLEAHHFKYALFRRPGDVHVHFFGTATLSFSDERPDAEGRHFRDRVRSVRPAASQPAQRTRKTSQSESARHCNKKAVAKGDAFPTGGGAIPRRLFADDARACPLPPAAAARTRRLVLCRSGRGLLSEALAARGAESGACVPRG